jgi:hypothetical protein
LLHNRKPLQITTDDTALVYNYTGAAGSSVVPPYRCALPVRKSPFSHKKYVVDLMALPLGEREVHNGGMIDGSARVRTDGQSVEAQGAARTAAG